MPTAAELRQSGPPAATTEDDGPNPIGVPDDYTARRPVDRGGMSADAAERYPSYREVPPRYYDGDDWRPANQSPEAIARVQQQMVDAGLLSGTYRIGVWDDRTRNAYRDLLSYANSIGADDATALNRWMQSGMGVREEPKAPRAPLTARVANPADIAAGLREVFKNRLGAGDIPEEKVQAMIAAYQGEQVQAQRQEYATQETGGTVVAAPDFEVWADTQAKMQDPTAYDSRKVVAGADYLARKLRGEV